MSSAWGLENALGKSPGTSQKNMALDSSKSTLLTTSVEKQLEEALIEIKLASLVIPMIYF